MPPDPTSQKHRRNKDHLLPQTNNDCIKYGTYSKHKRLQVKSTLEIPKTPNPPPPSPPTCLCVKTEGRSHASATHVHALTHAFQFDTTVGKKTKLTHDVNSILPSTQGRFRVGSAAPSLLWSSVAAPRLLVPLHVRAGGGITTTIDDRRSGTRISSTCSIGISSSSSGGGGRGRTTGGKALEVLAF